MDGWREYQINKLSSKFKYYDKIILDKWLQK